MLDLQLIDRFIQLLARATPSAIFDRSAGLKYSVTVIKAITPPPISLAIDHADMVLDLKSEDTHRTNEDSINLPLVISATSNQRPVIIKTLLQEVIQHALTLMPVGPKNFLLAR